jgi:APA family basic amino acid/polyamine antiporter
MNTGSGNGLKKELGLLSATAIVGSNMVGAGIFTTSGIIAAELPGPWWILACWLAGGAIALAGALCYAELATRMPHSGGEYIYLARLFHPALGFLSGWTGLIAGFSTPIALCALAFVEYMVSGLGGPALVEGLPSTHIEIGKKSGAIALIGVFTALHYRGRRMGTAVQNALTVLKFTIILGLLTLGFLWGNGSWTHFTAAKPDSTGVWALGTSLLIVSFAYTGWNASTYMAGELKCPRRTLPGSLVLGTGIVATLYLLMNLFILYAVPYAELRGVTAVFERAGESAFGDRVSGLFSQVVALTMLSSLSAYVMVGPRVLYAMARDGLFFRLAADVHPRNGVPGKAIVLQGVLAMLMVTVGTIRELLIYAGFTLAIFPVLAVAGLFVARARAVGGTETVEVPGYPYVPILFIVSSGTLVAIAALDAPWQAAGGLATVMVGVPFYFTWIRGRRVQQGDGTSPGPHSLRYGVNSGGRLCSENASPVGGHRQ